MKRNVLNAISVRNRFHHLKNLEPICENKNKTKKTGLYVKWVYCPMCATPNRANVPAPSSPPQPLHQSQNSNQFGALDKSSIQAPSQYSSLDNMKSPNPHQYSTLEGMKAGSNQYGGLDKSSLPAPNQYGSLDKSSVQAPNQYGILDKSTLQAPNQYSSVDNLNIPKGNQYGILDSSNIKPQNPGTYGSVESVIANNPPLPSRQSTNSKSPQGEQYQAFVPNRK